MCYRWPARWAFALMVACLCETHSHFFVTLHGETNLILLLPLLLLANDSELGLGLG